MVEPLSLLAGAVTTYIVPKALEKIGEQVGETTLKKSGKLIQAARKAVQEKLKSTNTEGVLTLAQTEPTESNLQILEAILLNQMKTDKIFTKQLQELVAQLHVQSPSLQVVLDTVRIKGNATLGNIKQVSEGDFTEQVIGRNLGVGGDLVVGEISQENRDRK